MRCTACKSYIPEGATHCLDCGSSFDQIAICQHCGAEISVSARFCNKCGMPKSASGEISNHLEIKTPVNSTGDEGAVECSRCGENVPAGVQYCPTCGTNVTLNRKSEPEQSTGVVTSESDPTDPDTDIPECPRCGTVPRGSARFCHNCGRFHGSDIEDVICPYCGATNSLRYARCQYCGTDLPSGIPKQ